MFTKHILIYYLNCWKDGYSPSLVASYTYGAEGYAYESGSYITSLET